MIRTTRLILTLLAAVLIAGCTDGFPDEEAHFGLEDKVRPYEITLDPPEVAPGETVTATLRYHMPRPAAAAATWRVALDYDDGLYEADQVERLFVDVADVDPAVVDADGFVTQTARFTVPATVFDTTTAIAEVIGDEVMLALLGALPDGVVSQPPLRSEVSAFLASVTPEDLAALDPEAAFLVQRLADIFACAVRFRVTLEDGIVVDVVRRLTVRHSGRLGSVNTNTNCEVSVLRVGEIPRHDVDLGDLEDLEGDVIWHDLDLDGRVDVPLDPSHTYFIRARGSVQTYTSPFDDVRRLEEELELAWHYYRVDAPGSGHQFLVDDAGEEAESWELDEDVRLDPPGVGADYRVLAVMRDVRGEWARYHASPGSTTRELRVVFVAP